MEQSGPLLPKDDEEGMWQMRCENCVRCSTIENCNKCDFCRANAVCSKKRCFQAKQLFEQKLINDKKKEERRRRQDAELSSTIASVASGNENSVNSEKPKKGRKTGGAAQEKEKTKKQQKEEKASKKNDDTNHRPTRQTDSKKKQKVVSEKGYEPRQCLNPDCIKESREESKYCSDECGRMLARMRLTEVLPSRTKEYFGGSRTHEADMERKKLQCEQEMKELTEYEKKLVACIDKLHAYIGKLAELTPEGTETKVDESLFEACIVCGQVDVPLRKYAKHVETCWTRAEKAISFGGLELNSESIYCETLNQKTKTYCKRLKSLCPEHRHQGPEEAMKICGYPTKWDNTFTMSEIIEADDPFGDSGCKLNKETCSKHLKWVPTFRGSIELEQSILMNKIGELYYEARKCSLYLDWSKNVVLALMHNPKLSTSMPSSSTT